MTIHAERVAETVTPAEPTAPVAETDVPLVEQETLVEEISIDGMCGVY